MHFILPHGHVGRTTILKLLINAEFCPYSPDFLDLDEIADEGMPRIAPAPSIDIIPYPLVTTVMFFLVGLECLLSSHFFF